MQRSSHPVKTPCNQVHSALAEAVPEQCVKIYDVSDRVARPPARLACLSYRSLFGAIRDPGGQLSHRLSLPGHFRQDVRPAHLVKRGCRAEILERSSLQRIDAVASAE